MIITPLLGFLGFNFVGPQLPSFYTDYYSQEDRLKAMAKVVQRLIKYDEAALKKINEVIEIINFTEIGDLAALVEAVEEVTAGLQATDAEVDAIIVELNEIKSDFNALAGRVTAVETKATANASAITNLTTKTDATNGRVTAVEGRLSGLDTKTNNTNTAVSSLVAKTDATNIRVGSLEGKDEALQLEINAVGNTVVSNTSRIVALEEGGGGGGTDPALEGRVEALEEDFTSEKERLDYWVPEINNNTVRIVALEEGDVNILAGAGEYLEDEDGAMFWWPYKTGRTKIRDFDPTADNSDAAVFTIDTIYRDSSSNLYILTAGVYPQQSAASTVNVSWGLTPTNLRFIQVTDKSPILSVPSNNKAWTDGIYLYQLRSITIGGGGNASTDIIIATGPALIDASLAMAWSGPATSDYSRQLATYYTSPSSGVINFNVNRPALVAGSPSVTIPPSLNGLVLIKRSIK